MWPSAASAARRQTDLLARHATVEGRAGFRATHLIESADWERDGSVTVLLAKGLPMSCVCGIRRRAGSEAGSL